MEDIIYAFEAEKVGIRVDKYLALKLPEFSRAYIQKLADSGAVLVNGRVVKGKEKLDIGAKVLFTVPKPKPLEILPENIPLDILYEDEDIIVVNKAKGMVVHPAAGHPGGTLVNALMYHCGTQLSGINGVLRPGIVHRIDRDTTGVLVACKNDQAHRVVAQQLKEHSITRRYQAIVHGYFQQESGSVNAPIGRHPTDRKRMAVNQKNGKEAITHYRVLQNLSHKLVYIECCLETGRTHQIRVHMSSIHHPLLGDLVYGIAADEKLGLSGQTLHAGVLGFIHPRTGNYMEFSAPLPEYFQELLKK